MTDCAKLSLVKSWPSLAIYAAQTQYQYTETNAGALTLEACEWRKHLRTNEIIERKPTGIDRHNSCAVSPIPPPKVPDSFFMKNLAGRPNYPRIFPINIVIHRLHLQQHLDPIERSS